MKSFTSLIFISLSFCLFAQTDFKTFKKEIPVKGLQEVNHLAGSQNLYIYQAKKENGIWNNQIKQIVAKGITSVNFIEWDSSWLQIDIGVSHILYNEISGYKVTAKSPFKIYPSMLPDFLILSDNLMFGVIHVGKNQMYMMAKGNESNEKFFRIEDTLSWGEIAYKEFSYVGEQKQFYMDEYIGDGVYGSYSIELLDNYILEKTGSFGNEFRVSQPDTGQEILKETGWFFKWKDGYAYNDQGYYTNFDQSFNTIIANRAVDQFTVQDFEKLVGSNVHEVNYFSDNQYMVKNDEGMAIYSLTSDEFMTPYYDIIFPIGQDVLTSGDAFFIKNGTHVGYYHTNGHLIEPFYSSVELRQFEDGSFGFKTDNTLQKFTREKFVNYYYAYGDTVKWTSDMESKSSVYNHITLIGQKYLVLSLRKCTADTHDAVYYTATEYQDGSGVYDLQNERWMLRDYHFINPFKGYYIATTAGSIYRNWLKAEIYDSNFNLISKDEFNSPFIYKDKLILKNKKYELVEYDITKKKVMRTIGKTSSSYDDYLFYNGYLFLGSANFEDDELEACSGFEILDVMTPELNIIPHPGMGYFLELGDGLIAMGKFLEENHYGRDWNGYPQRPKEIAIMDIYTGKIISGKRFTHISVYDDEVYLNWDNNGTNESATVKIGELRKFLNR